MTMRGVRLKTESFNIDGIPALVCGESSERAYLFIHGQAGSKQEAMAFAELAVPAGYQVLGVDLPGHGERLGGKGFDPWTAAPELARVAGYMRGRWDSVSLRANSIGAYFSMLALADTPPEKALFVSPIVDMERLILDMMAQAEVSEETLRSKGEVSTQQGETLSWNYLCWVREHPLSGWSTPTAILYAGQDNLTSRQTIAGFSQTHHASLEVYEPGEHWFHTPEQLKVLRDWEIRNI